MKKFNFPVLADSVFYTFAGWIVALGILRYFRVPTALAITASVLIGLSLGIFCFLISSHRTRRRALSRFDKERREQLMLHLALEKRERVRALLLEAFLKDGQDAALSDDGIKLGDSPAIPLFSMEPVSADKIAAILQELGEEQFTVLCSALSPQAQQLLNSFGQRYLCADEIYALLNRTDCFPEKLICGNIPRKSVKRKLRVSLSKRNARPYFVCGLLLLVMSMFVIFPIYYLVTGTCLMLTAVLVRAVGYA